MKPLLICKNDIQGGACRAAYRLHQSLHGIGVPAQMLVQNKVSDDRFVIGAKTLLRQKLSNFRESLDALPVNLYKQRENTTFWSEWLPDTINNKVNKLNPDIINLHWICGGYLQIETIGKFNKPVAWTLHDMWPFTGGCHYSGDCDRYTQSCGNCPQLKSKSKWDLSSWVWQRKAKTWAKLNLTVITPSRWLAERARSSSLFKDVRIEVIPNGIDTTRYKPVKRIARELLNLPQDKQLILFGAMKPSDRRKGFHLLEPALQSLSKSGWREHAELIVFGSSQPNSQADLGFRTHYLGRLGDDIALALVYAAADVLIAPSIQDNLPNTVLEALACGTPCVAFNTGGLPDAIEHQINGYLAQPYKIEELAQGIVWVLENEDRQQKLSYRAREKAEKEFSLALQANRYLAIFTEMVEDYQHIK